MDFDLNQRVDQSTQSKDSTGKYPFLSGGTFSAEDALRLNPLQLAYIGDTVWELIIRHRLIQKRFNVRHMHTLCVHFVNAASQAAFLSRLAPKLTDPEHEMIQRGRNAHAHHPSPRHQQPEDYAASTAFEALIGFLYLSGQTERLSLLTGLILDEESSWQITDS